MRRPEIRIFQEHISVRASSRCDPLTTRLCEFELAVQNRRLECGGALFPGDLRQAMAGSHAESQASRSQMLETQCAQSVLARRVGLAQGKHFQPALLGSFRGSRG